MMKKNLILVTIAVILLLFGIFWYISLPKPTQNAGIKSQETIMPEISNLTVINSDVQIKEPTDGALKKVEIKTTEVLEGTYVKTSLNGRALIESENKTTTMVDKNSEFTITTQQKNKTGISLAFGNLWATVQKVFGQDEYYQIQTPNAVITVRGTSFGVFYANGVTTVMVTQSKIWLLSVDPVTKNQIGNEVEVNEHFKGVVADGQEPVISPINTTNKKLDWYVVNNPNDVPPPKIACNKNSDCGTPTATGQSFCQDNSVFQEGITHTCNKPGTAAAFCSNSTTTAIITTCNTSQMCRNGGCVDIGQGQGGGPK